MSIKIIVISFALTTLLSACGSEPSTGGSSSTSSSSGSSVDTDGMIIQEGELGHCTSSSFVEAEHEGFSGAGYTNTENHVGAEMMWTVTADSNTTVSLSIRFAYDGSPVRQAQVFINDGGSQTLNFEPTGTWTTWINKTLTVNLNAGVNTIRLVSDSSEGLPNIDSLGVTGSSVSPEVCGNNTGSTGDSSGEQQGFISLADPSPGWASEDGGTLGGGDTNSAITVSSMQELRNAVSNNEKKVVLVNPGNYSGELTPGANTTIIGKAPGVTITGSIKISGSDKHNIIIRNLAVRGERCNSYEECKAGADAVYIGNDAHHVWLDHLDIADGQDGNCDITKGGDFVTVSWSKFHYTYDKEHRFSNLIAGSDDEPQSIGKLRITYMNSWWGDRVDARQPRGRFGKIHMLNNYHNTGGSQIHGVGKQMSLISEASHYEEPGRSIFTDMGEPQGWKGIDNIGSAKDLNASRGSVFTVPYSYIPLPASEVKNTVTSSNCGAGNTCQLQL